MTNLTEVAQAARTSARLRMENALESIPIG